MCRGTVGGCVATTLGAVIHELGHALDLAHSDDGFMARGFDDLDKFFTCSSLTSSGKASTEESLIRSMAELLPRCGRGGGSVTVSPSPETTARTTTTIMGRSSAGAGTTYLEEYQRKKYYRKMMQECGNAFWDKSAAAILSCHP